MVDFRRQSDRVPAKVPVEIEGGLEGFTRNVSPRGAYFVVEGDLKPGETIKFSMDFESAPSSVVRRVLRLNCEGRVMRVEAADNNGLGVAVEILNSALEIVEPASARGSQRVKVA